ncbi:DMT family transporter [Chelativorans sp. J32]|uniref:DMT family transporter n=1 Tax=Chelativorans sp. J32 TaxID=935840 RepID=UPI0004AD46F7|nr:DMT family transporter [Chelativorans sp. J32]
MLNSAYPLLLLTTLSWGGNAVAGKLAVGHISPFALTFLRWILAVAVLLPVAWGPLRRDWPKIRSNLGLLTLLGIMGFTCFNATMYSALTLTSAVNVSIEQGAIPLVIIVVNFVFFRVRASWLQIAGFLLSLVGIALTASHGDLRRLTAMDINFGDLLMLFAVLAYGFYTVALRFKPEIHWVSMITVLAVSALVSSFPLMIWEYSTGDLLLPDFTGWMVVIYVALMPSVVSQVFYIRGVELIGANRAGLFVNLVPIFGTLLSILLLGEEFFLYHAVALLLVFFGIWLAEASSRKKAPVPARVRAPIDGS